MGWNDWSYTRKGGVIGGIIGIVLVILFVLETLFISFVHVSFGLTNLANFFYRIILFPISAWTILLFQSIISPTILLIASNLVIVFGLAFYGLIIGWIFDKIKSRNK